MTSIWGHVVLHHYDLILTSNFDMMSFTWLDCDVYMYYISIMLWTHIGVLILCIIYVISKSYDYIRYRSGSRRQNAIIMPSYLYVRRKSPLSRKTDVTRTSYHYISYISHLFTYRWYNIGVIYCDHVLKQKKSVHGSYIC